MRSGDYVSIYRESAPRFKSTATEAQFVSVMQEFVRQHEGFKAAIEIAWQTGVDSTAGKVHFVTYELELGNAKTREQLTLARADSGVVQLWKLQIDPPKLKQ